MSLSLNKHSILGTLSYNQVDQNWTDVETLVNQINSRLPQNNWQATVDPVASNDQTQGYVAGSRWYNTSTGDLFICVSASTGAAVWIAETTLTFADVTLDAVTSAGNTTTNAVDVGELRSTDWVGTVANGALGHVVEMGSNANGQYVKFADGTMICTRVVTNITTGSALGGIAGAFIGSTTVYSFSAVFIAVPSIAFGCAKQSGGGAAIGVVAGATAMTTTATGNISLLSNDATLVGSIYITANGRWF